MYLKCFKLEVQKTEVLHQWELTVFVYMCDFDVIYSAHHLNFTWIYGIRGKNHFYLKSSIFLEHNIM
jgi:hypothetical protein